MTAGANRTWLGSVVSLVSELTHLLAGGVRVQVRAHVLHLQLQRLLRSLLRALEGHVLEEVRGAVVGASAASARSATRLKGVGGDEQPPTPGAAGSGRWCAPDPAAVLVY